MAPERQAKGF